MTRLACTVAVAVTVTLSLSACGKRADQSKPAGSGSPPSPPPAAAAAAAPSPPADPITDPIADENPTIPVVKAAFNGTPPAFPQLSKDGRTAAVELDTL